MGALSSRENPDFVEKSSGFCKCRCYLAPEGFFRNSAVRVVCDEDLELLLDLLAGDGRVLHDVVHVLLLQPHGGALLRPAPHPGLGQDVEALGPQTRLPLHCAGTHLVSWLSAYLHLVAGCVMCNCNCFTVPRINNIFQLFR